MFYVQFPSYRLIEFPSPQVFHQHVTHWLTLREAENAYLLGDLSQRLRQNPADPAPLPRYFALKDNEQLVAAAALFPDGHLLLTWASPEMLQSLANSLADLHCNISRVFAPAHVAGTFARAWEARTGQTWNYGRDERVYQLARVRHTPSPTGHLALATPADAAFLLPWMNAFQSEADYQAAAPMQQILNSLIADSVLYLWKDPHPVAMAAWVAPTPHGGCINFVFVPPESRGHQHGKNIVAALGRHLLSRGTRYCFILTDTADTRLNNLYQSVGARTVAELLQCHILPAPSQSKTVPPLRGLNVTFSSAR